MVCNPASPYRLGWILVLCAVLVARTPVAADVWDDWDYEGHKRTLKVWARNGNAAFKAAVKAAIDNWNSDANNGDWTLEEGTEADHDVDVGTGDTEGGALGNCEWFDNDATPGADGCTVTMNEDADWGEGADKQNLERAIKHELGHAQRMDDTDQEGDIMNGSQGPEDDNLTPSEHDKSEAKASHATSDKGVGTLPASITTGVETYFQIVPDPGVDLRLSDAAGVSVTPLDPSHIQVRGIRFDPSDIKGYMLAAHNSFHNEGFILGIGYRDGSSAQFSGIVTTNPVDPPAGKYPHAVAGPDMYAYAGHPFTLDGGGSYHDDPAYTPSLVHVWNWQAQPNLPLGGAQTEALTKTLPVGVYNFDLQVEDLFTQKSTDSATVTVTPYPPPGADCTNSKMQYTLTDPQGNNHTINLTGSTSIVRSGVGDTDKDGLLGIETEVTSMTLMEDEPRTFGVRLTAEPAGPNTGLIEQQTTGNYWPVDSFFDITYRIEFIGGSQQPLIGRERLNGTPTSSLPFDNTTVFSNAGGRVRLLDKSGGWTGWWGHCDSAASAALLYPEPLRHIDCHAAKFDVTLTAPSGGTSSVQLNGPASIRRGDPYPGTPPEMIIDTEIVGMELEGSTAAGAVRIKVGPNAATGSRESAGKTFDLPDGVGDSFFDVFFEVELPGVTQSIPGHNCRPVHLQGTTAGMPFPVGTTFTSVDPAQELLDETGNPTGWSIRVSRAEIGPAPPPEPYTDCFSSTAKASLTLPSGPMTLLMSGPTVVKRADPPALGDPIPIELVALDLTSTEPIVAVLNEDPDRASGGQATPPFTSEFHVYPVFTFENGTKLKTCEPVRLQASGDLPFPPGTRLIMPVGEPSVQLYENGLPHGSLDNLRIAIGSQCTQVSTPAEAKSQPEVSPTRLIGPVVHSVSEDFFYVQTQYPAEGGSGLSGIRVKSHPPNPNVGDRVAVSGTLRVENGEALIDAAYIELMGSVHPPNPIHVGLPILGGTQYGIQPPVGSGTGLNNVGLHIRATGWVYEYDAQSRLIRIADQFPPSDGSHKLKVDCGRSAVFIPPLYVGDCIVVTGGLGAEVTPGGILPLMGSVGKIAVIVPIRPPR